MLSEFELYHELGKKLKNIYLIFKVYIFFLIFFLIGSDLHLVIILLIPYSIFIYKIDRLNTTFLEISNKELIEVKILIKNLYSQKTVLYLQLFDFLILVVVVIFLKISNSIPNFLAIFSLISGIIYVSSIVRYFEHRKKTNNYLSDLKDELSKNNIEQLLTYINHEVEYIWYSKLYYYLLVIIIFTLDVFYIANYYR